MNTENNILTTPATIETVENNTPTAHMREQDIEQAIEDWKAYQDLCDRLLEDSDYQPIYDKQSNKYKGFKKKSAWYKLKRAFNITTRPIDKQVEREPNGRIISCTYTVEATTSDGRVSVDVGTCSIFDKENENNDKQKQYFERGEDVPNSVLRKSFSNPEHDIPATALTRATIRAISAHIGAGEVSAEELGDDFGKSEQIYTKKKEEIPEKTSVSKKQETIIDAVPTKTTKTSTKKTTTTKKTKE